VRYVYKPGHPKASQFGFVAVVDLDYALEEKQALHAPILAGRFYENTAATDGVDIGSRKKHREYMKSRGLAMADDFKQTWGQDARNREAIRKGQNDRRERREAIERTIHQIHKP
jgi:hypothetical protein